MKLLMTIAALFLMAWEAHAQEAPQVDPRLAGPAIVALQSELALRAAQVKALQEDMAAREKEWAAYSAPLWAEPKVK